MQGSEMNRNETTSLSGAHHLGVVVRDIEKVVEHYESNFSCVFQTPPETGTERIRVVHHKGAMFRGKPTDYGVKLAFTSVGPIYIEFIQPLEGAAIAKEFLETHGEGVQHVGLIVDDLQAELAKWGKLGFKILQQCQEPHHPSWAYVDSDVKGGIMYELVQQWTR